MGVRSVIAPDTQVAETFAGTPAPAAEVCLRAGDYVARLAANEHERRLAYRLRFLVFNLELNEGLESAYAEGYDTDRYDAVCDHMVVEYAGAVVGTYRLQTGAAAEAHFGFYSEQEFALEPLAALRPEIVELGRACLHRDHRSSEVLHLLWRAIARYVIGQGGRYMMGCCSLSSVNCTEGLAVYRSLQNYLVEPHLRTMPRGQFRLTCEPEGTEEMRPPKLLRAYLTIGARICGPPAIDRQFKTIDFLTLLDLHTLHPRVAARFLEGA